MQAILLLLAAVFALVLSRSLAVTALDRGRAPGLLTGIVRAPALGLLLLAAGMALSAGARSQAPAAPKPAVAKPVAPATTKGPSASGTGQVIVDIAGLESAKGQLLGALFRGERGFPNQVKYALARKALPLREKRARFVFEGVTPGEFAFAVHHDENSNLKMETGLFGIPSEGYGTSRDAKPNFGPPSYSDARLVLAPGEQKRIVVHMRY
jgi:uncharacterized protein (DUF2141 family)